MLSKQVGVVLGNHPSRLIFDLEQFKVPVYGCNAIYRDFHPKELFVIDEEMYDEISKNYKGSTRFCRRGIPDFSTPPSEIFCCTGLAAVWGMTVLENIDEVHLIGWNPWNTKKRENIYDGTNCYPKGDELIQFGLAPWVKPFVKLFENTKYEFVIFYEDLPSELQLKNVRSTEMRDLFKFI